MFPSDREIAMSIIISIMGKWAHRTICRYPSLFPTEMRLRTKCINHSFECDLHFCRESFLFHCFAATVVREMFIVLCSFAFDDLLPRRYKHMSSSVL